jgi:hypothetical protein
MNNEAKGKKNAACDESWSSSALQDRRQDSDDFIDLLNVRLEVFGWQKLANVDQP